MQREQEERGFSHAVFSFTLSIAWTLSILSAPSSTSSSTPKKTEQVDMAKGEFAIHLLLFFFLEKIIADQSGV